MEKILDSTSEDPTPTLKTQSLVTGITNEWKPNSYINKSVCGETWHDFYLQDSSEGSLDSSDCKCQTFSKSSKCLFELRYTNLLEKYYKETTTLKERIAVLRNETELAYQEISKLKTQVFNIQQDYTLQIHNIQARHQQKMLRTKNDIEALVSSIETKLENQLKGKYEQLFLDMENKCEAKIEEMNSECEEKIAVLRNEYEIEIIKLQEEAAEEEASRIEQKVNEIVKAEVKEKVQKVEEKYEEMLKKLRKERVRVKQEKVEVRFDLENSNDNILIQEKIEGYEKIIKELREVIKSKDFTIQEMSLDLSASFKRKPKKICELTPTSTLNIIQRPLH